MNMPSPNSYSARQVGDVLVVQLQEQAGFARPEMVRELSDVLTDPEWRNVCHVLVDCMKLSFAGSMFLESMIQLHRGVQRRRGHFALCAVNDELREILSIARFDTLWHSYTSVEEGLQALME